MRALFHANNWHRFYLQTPERFSVQSGQSRYAKVPLSHQKMNFGVPVTFELEKLTMQHWRLVSGEFR